MTNITKLAEDLVWSKDNITGLDVYKLAKSTGVPQNDLARACYIESHRKKEIKEAMLELPIQDPGYTQEVDELSDESSIYIDFNVN